MKDRYVFDVHLLMINFICLYPFDRPKCQGTQRAHGDVSLGTNRRLSYADDGGSVEIPEFLRKKGRSLFPRM